MGGQGLDIGPGGAGRGRGARSRTEMERVGGGTGREGWKGDLGGAQGEARMAEAEFGAGRSVSGKVG